MTALLGRGRARPTEPMELAHLVLLGGEDDGLAIEPMAEAARRAG